MECTRKLTLLIGLTISISAHSSDVNDCLNIEDSNARLACYDQTLGYAGATVPVSTSVGISKRYLTRSGLIQKCRTPSGLRSNT